MYTPMHRELGLPASIPLDWSLIQRVVEAKMHEQRDLDFKMIGYNSQDPHSASELAKDLCAMANSGGGWIICGIRTDPKKDIAEELTPFTIDKNTDQNIYRIAWTNVQPSLSEVKIHAISSPDEKWIYAIEVPPTELFPHLCLYQKGNESYPFYAPIRNGSSTVGLTEPELRRLYRESYQLKKDKEANEKQLYDEFAEYGQIYDGLTFIFMGIPEYLVENRLDQATINQSLDGIKTNQYRYDNNGLWLLRNFGDEFARSRRGLRSWVLRNERDMDQHRYWRLELKDNGILRIAIQLGGWIGCEDWSEYPAGTKNQASQRFIEDALVEAYAFLVKCQQKWHPYTYKITAGLSGPAEMPLIIRGVEAWYRGDRSQLIPESASKQIYHFQPISAYLDINADDKERLHVLSSLGEDIINQGEISLLQSIIAE